MKRAVVLALVLAGCTDDPGEDETDAADLAAQQADELAAQPPVDVDAADLVTSDVDDEDEAEFAEQEQADTDDDAVAATDELVDDIVSTDPDAPNAVASIPSKIRYVLVIVKENHTFDNYFTGFPGATSSAHAFKLDKQTARSVRFVRPLAPPDTLASGPGHTHGKAIAAYRNGHMDGFSVNPGKTPYIRYTEDQLPAYWKYARQFGLADDFLSTSLAPSAPGHEVFWFSRSTTIDNPKCHLANKADCGHGCPGNHLTATAFNPRTGVERKVKPCFDLPSLPDHLPPDYTWIDYGG